MEMSLRSSTSIPSSPSSTPPSSPYPFPDSSPASSPKSAALSDDDVDLSPASQHPFAGSAKQIKKFRAYEKKPKRTLSHSGRESPTPAASKKVRYNDEQPPSPGEFQNLKDDPLGWNHYLYQMTPEEKFRDVVDRAVTDSSLHLSFEKSSLPFLPEDAIRDLQKIVILDEPSEHVFLKPDILAREWGSAALAAHNRRRSQGHRMNFSRTSSTRVLSGVPRTQMHLLLADNRISRLPPQLFHFERLAVLSLRANNLTFLPPEICLLSSLKELNIACNQLTFLPSEIMDMKLNILSIHPNPFKECPPSEFKRTLSRSRTMSKSHLFDRPKLVSPIEVYEDGFPSLFEMCLRALFSMSPANSTSSSPRSQVEFPYDLSVELGASLPPLVKHRLHFASPGSIKGYSADAQPPPDDITGVGFCPSPCHHQDGHRPLFFQHYEQRFTWESTIAGVENMGDIPVRWRGCQKGCLAFLAPNDTKDKGIVGQALVSELTSTSNVVHALTDPGLEDIINPITLGAVSFTDAEDFDDDE